LSVHSSPKILSKLTRKTTTYSTTFKPSHKFLRHNSVVDSCHTLFIDFTQEQFSSVLTLLSTWKFHFLPYFCFRWIQINLFISIMLKSNNKHLNIISHSLIDEIKLICFRDISIVLLIMSLYSFVFHNNSISTHNWSVLNFYELSNFWSNARIEIWELLWIAMFDVEYDAPGELRILWKTQFDTLRTWELNAIVQKYAYVF
jgi:hypothetical protein